IRTRRSGGSFLRPRCSAAARPSISTSSGQAGARGRFMGLSEQQLADIHRYVEAAKSGGAIVLSNMSQVARILEGVTPCDDAGDNGGGNDGGDGGDDSGGGNDNDGAVPTAPPHTAPRPGPES